MSAKTRKGANFPAYGQNAAIGPPDSKLPSAPSPLDLTRFYERSYSADGEDGLRYARWRALGAVGKADHAIALCSQAAIAPASTLDVGCGDGALLGELARRSFGGRLHGVEIASAAVEVARGLPGVESVELYDGQALPGHDGAYDLGVLSHVLEHVPQPASLLREVARVCRAVVVEVPLEANLSARRASKREHAEEVGHLQRLSREAIRAIVSEAGLRVAGEIEDPLPLAVQLFFADSLPARAKARLKWAVRTALHRLWPTLARRLFTIHYACLCLPCGRAAQDGRCQGRR